MSNEISPASAVNSAIIFLKGKIQSSRKIDLKDKPPMFEIVLNTPAKDAYSHPNKFCILSDYMLGEADKEISVKAEVTCRPWKDNSGNWRYPHILRAVV